MIKSPYVTLITMSQTVFFYSGLCMMSVRAGSPNMVMLRQPRPSYVLPGAANQKTSAFKIVGRWLKELFSDSG